jgi:hypothetical protein
VLWQLWGGVTGGSVLVLAWSIRGLLRLPLLPRDETGSPMLLLVRRTPPLGPTGSPVSDPALRIVVPGFGRLGSAPTVASVPASDRRAAVTIIAASRKASPIDFDLLALPVVDELGPWEPWRAEPMPAVLHAEVSQLQPWGPEVTR